MQVLERVISRSCQIKATIVERDERDRDERIILNYGHTVGHAIETLTDYRRYRHGEAVAIGMHSEARLSHQLGVLSGRVVARQAKLLHTIGLPIQAESVDPQDIVQILRLDKKVVDGRVRFVLPKSIGEVFVADGVSDDLLYQVLSGQVEGG
jgi:3-dehydroquinate synthase